MDPDGNYGQLISQLTEGGGQPTGSSGGIGLTEILGAELTRRGR